MGGLLFLRSACIQGLAWGYRGGILRRAVERIGAGGFDGGSFGHQPGLARKVPKGGSGGYNSSSIRRSYGPGTLLFEAVYALSGG